MGLYLIADLVVELKNKHSHLERLCADYKYDGTRSADFCISVDERQLRAERLASETAYSDGYLESVCAYRNLCMQLPLRDAFLLHASVITHKDRTIAFVADSGVGKTTHTRHWLTCFEDVTVINGDKPIIRFVDGVPYVYGTPWRGKEGMGCNMRMPLTDVCFIVRNETDFVSAPTDTATSLLGQIIIPPTPDLAIKTLDMADKLVKSCNVFQLNCTAEPSSAVTAYNHIFGGL